jgi:hypothetical protein
MTFSSFALIYIRNNYQVFLSVFFSGKFCQFFGPKNREKNIFKNLTHFANFLEKIAIFLIYHKIRKETRGFILMIDYVQSFKKNSGKIKTESLLMALFFGGWVSISRSQKFEKIGKSLDCYI